MSIPFATNNNIPRVIQTESTRSAVVPITINPTNVEPPLITPVPSTTTFTVPSALPSLRSVNNIGQPVATIRAKTSVPPIENTIISTQQLPKPVMVPSNVQRITPNSTPRALPSIRTVSQQPIVPVPVTNTTKFAPIPVPVPVRSPAKATVPVPVRSPTKATVPVPVRSPTKATVPVPVRSPTKATVPVPVRSPTKATVPVPVMNNDQNDDDLELQKAIMLSTMRKDITPIIDEQEIERTASQTRLANDRKLREQQDIEYLKSLAIDEEKARKAAAAALAAAEAAARAAEEAAEILRQTALLRPAQLRYPSAEPDKIINIKVRYPDGKVGNYSFHREEPLSTLIAQIKYDTKNLSGITLTLSPNKLLLCDPSTSLVSCGIINRSVLLVDYV